ncbi:hypothetical protein PROFUN_04567 [Planoprotostelium fungivorum]|uniref:PAS domain-containing protein n=1 Tax=Planoprotostelium fungivorum TaxID=1890364 RepID=A0A2P6NBL9_9EUKA|nr:hypothetical protein PROFUN_04567 [Planoprotostelium fungivorum]
MSGISSDDLKGTTLRSRVSKACYQCKRGLVGDVRDWERPVKTDTFSDRKGRKNKWIAQKDRQVSCIIKRLGLNRSSDISPQPDVNHTPLPSEDSNGQTYYSEDPQKFTVQDLLTLEQEMGIHLEESSHFVEALKDLNYQARACAKIFIAREWMTERETITFLRNMGVTYVKLFGSHDSVVREQFRQEQNRRLEEQKKILMNNYSPCILFNEMHQICYANPAFQRMIGTTEESFSLTDSVALFDYTPQALRMSLFTHTTNGENPVIFACYLRVFHNVYGCRTVNRHGLEWLEGTAWNHRELNSQNIPLWTVRYFLPSANTFTNLLNEFRVDPSVLNEALRNALKGHHERRSYDCSWTIHARSPPFIREYSHKQGIAHLDIKSENADGRNLSNRVDFGRCPSHHKASCEDEPRALSRYHFRFRGTTSTVKKVNLLLMNASTLCQSVIA